MSRRRSLIVLTGSFIFMLATLMITPFIGSQSLSYQDVWQTLQGVSSPSGLIFFNIRLPRILLALLTGGTLAVAGVIFQALLRNPLATPYTLGVASGSALGALFVIKTGIAFAIPGLTAVQFGAMTGSLLTISFVYLLARRSARVSVHTLILAGVTISYFFSALILILHYIADFTETHQMIRWTIGGLDVIQYSTLLKSMPLLLIAFVVFVGMGRSLNLISTTEDSARSKGVNVERLQKTAFVLASLATGIVVSLSGPIGFIGLIIPHLLRLMMGPDHRFLIPASIFFGGGFLALADTVARTILAPVDLPVGIVTTVIGGPFFLWMLIRQR